MWKYAIVLRYHRNVTAGVVDKKFNTVLSNPKENSSDIIRELYSAYLRLKFESRDASVLK
jgi:hypothetical protein